MLKKQAENVRNSIYQNNYKYMPRYLHINFQIWFPNSNLENLKSIKNGEIQILRTPTDLIASVT